MFLDESGDHSLDKIDKSYPMFVLAGCIFDFDYYASKAEVAVNKLKRDYFGNTNLILRSYDIRKQRNQFSSLVNKTIREKFYGDINNLISTLKFTIIAAVIDKSKLKNQYVHPENPYDLCFQFILERAIMYLGRSEEQMIFRIESRETHNDRKLAKVYESFRSKDQKLFKMSEIQSKLVDLSFNQKNQNIAGTQVADLIAYPIGRWGLDKKKENLAFQIIEKKLHTKNGVYLNCGLKIFP